MRPRRFIYTLAAANLTGFASNATGATWPLTATTAGDGVAHPVTIRNDSVTDHAAKTVILTGTDANGQPQTETMNLPAGSATVTSTKYFLTLTSVVPSATIGADTMDIGWTALAQTPIFPVDHAKLTGPVLSVGVGGTITFVGQQTATPIYKYPNAGDQLWQTLIASGSASAIAQGLSGITGVRVTVASHTNGILTVSISQARV